MRDYQKLAQYVGSLKPDPDAKVSYELFAGALVWSDEIPPPGSYSLEDFSPAELRGIWHYRSSLILGNPKENLRASWEAAQQAFPNWPGFDPRRREACWAETLTTMETRAVNRWTELDDNFNKSLAEELRK